MKLEHCRHFQQINLECQTGHQRGKRKQGARGALRCPAIRPYQSWQNAMLWCGGSRALPAAYSKLIELCHHGFMWLWAWQISEFSRRVRCFPAVTLHARAHLRHFPSTHHICLMQYTCSCLLTLSIALHISFPSAFLTLQAPLETVPLLACVLLAIAPTEGPACACVHNKIIFALGGRNSADTPWQFHLPWEKRKKRRSNLAQTCS